MCGSRFVGWEEGGGCEGFTERGHKRIMKMKMMKMMKIDEIDEIDGYM